MGGCYSCQCFGKEYGVVETSDTDCTEENSVRSSPRWMRQRSPPVKAKIVHGYKDESLYKTMEQCRDIRKGLRRVEDPDVARREKKKRLRQENLRCKIKGKNTSEGYLGMTPGSLHDIRKSLRQVERGGISPKSKSKSKSIQASDSFVALIQLRRQFGVSIRCDVIGDDDDADALQLSEVNARSTGWTRRSSPTSDNIPPCGARMHPDRCLSCLETPSCSRMCTHPIYCDVNQH
eukprot:jgi/Psemu1/291351/fgenesh1_pg.683_\